MPVDLNRKLQEIVDFHQPEMKAAEVSLRFYSGNVDVSELPSSYKPAATVRRQKPGTAERANALIENCPAPCSSG